MNNDIQTGVIAFGVAGQVFHAPFIQHTPGFSLKKISTSKKDAASTFGHLYPGTTFVQSANDILNDPEIELVVIGTPNDLHYPLAKQALEKGKHVLLEKPFTIYSSEADDLIGIAKEKNLVLTVNQNRRFDSTYLTLKKIIASKRLGDIVHYEAHFDRYRPVLKGVWREEKKPGSGILHDLGAHLIDQALDLFGKPDAITARVLSQRDPHIANDYFHLLLHYPITEVILHSGMLVKATGPFYIVHGKKGSFIKYGLDLQEAALKNGEMPVGDNWGQEPESLYGTLTTGEEGNDKVEIIKSEVGNYKNLFINLHNAIRNGEELEVKPEQARNNIRLVELAFQSAEEGRTVAVNW